MPRWHGRRPLAGTCVRPTRNRFSAPSAGNEQNCGRPPSLKPWSETMSVSESAVPAIHDDPADALAASGAPEDGTRADVSGGAALSWLERVFDEVLAPRGQYPSP